MPIDNLASVTWLSSSPGGQQSANTIHISDGAGGSPPSPATLALLATDLDTYFTTSYRSMLTTDSVLDAIKVAQVPDPAVSHDAYADYLLPKALAGTRTAGSTASPNEICGCISLKTNSGQRSYRGHLLTPPLLARDDLFGDLFNGSSNYYLAMIAFAAKLTTGMGASPTWTGTTLHAYNVVIYSRTLQVRSLPSVTGCILAKANQRVHWLRSRARGTTQPLELAAVPLLLVVNTDDLGFWLGLAASVLSAVVTYLHGSNRRSLRRKR